MKTPVHIVWRRPSPEKQPTWMILYANGSTSRIHSKMRDGLIGIALYLDRAVVVHGKDGEIEFVLQPEVRSQFHALMFVAALSFLVLIIGVVVGLIWLARLLF